MEKENHAYRVRAYRWDGRKYEISPAYVIEAQSKDGARNLLVKKLGNGWKASEAFEIKIGILEEIIG